MCPVQKELYFQRRGITSLFFKSDILIHLVFEFEEKEKELEFPILEFWWVE